MDNRLDELFGRLAVGPVDRSLEGLEHEVGRAIARRRSEARTAAALAPVQLASVALALVVGAAGGLGATSTVLAHTYGTPFTRGAELAPSTLLGRG